jgi:hypothetical protein
MKRIANKVAVATICFTISGLQKIRIVDYENEYDCTNNKNGKVIFDGLLKEANYDYKYCKWFDSECRGLRLDGDTIIFDTYTKYEEYR